MHPGVHTTLPTDWMVQSISENGISGKELSIAREVVNRMGVNDFCKSPKLPVPNHYNGPIGMLY